MDDKRLTIFVQTIAHYLTQTASHELILGTPYLNENKEPMTYDFTGIIGVSGGYKGCVYFTAPRALLKHMLLSMGESELHDENLNDMVGEVANIISGNARKDLGQEFMISVPVVVRGELDEIYLPKNIRSYVIPLFWNSYRAAIVISLDQ